MVPENSNYNGINPVGMNKNTNNPNYQIAAGSLQSTVPTNQYLKPIKSNQDIFNSNVRNSCVSLALMRIPCLEWKNNVNKGTKTVEYYLNVFYNKKKNNLSLNDPSRTKIKNSSISYKDDDNLTNIEDLPFKQKEHILSSGEEDKIIKILKNQIVFQGVSPEILSVIASEILILTIPEGKIIYDISDDGNFFYIIGKGKVVVNIQDNDNNVLGQWSTFGEISLFTEKKREEVIISKEPCELYTIDGESFRDIQKRNNEMVLKERYNFLNNIALFESLDKISKYNVAQKLKKKEFHSNNKIITKGEKGDKLYIIKEGIVSCRIGLQEIRRLSNNEYFGQNAILIDVKRGADIIALNKTVCYEISKDDLKEALTEDYIEIILFCFFKNAIEKNSSLKNIFIDSLLQDIFKCFSIQQYIKHERIYDPKNKIPLKSNNKKLVLILEGSLFKDNLLLADKGKILGEELLSDTNQTISEEIYANPDAITFEANLFDIAKVLKIDLSQDKDNKEKPLNILRAINKLKKIYLFKNLSEKTLESIAEGMKKQKFKPNEYIIEENTIGDKFFLIIKGRVRITVKGEFVRDLDSGDCLGENSLLTDSVLRTASAIALEKVLCYVLSKNDFQVILNDENTREYLLRKLALQDTEISLSSLHYIKFLGKGKFGTVSLVHNKKNIYAIKAISRKSVEREKILAKYFVNERKIMLSLDHPFIIKMVKSMKNKHFCFLLIEFVNGTNLDEYLSHRESKQNLYETQFYIGSMLLMLDYLQKKYIAHRDIKPSNIMIDSNGYLKMIDFGTAKILTDYTSTIIGTPHYIAPEILQGRGYSLSCDFWSLGICMYEIFYGKYPFGNYANEVIEIYKEVLRNDFSFPCENTKVVNVNSFIRCLLNKKVNERTCNVSKLKRKAFFEGFEFDKLNDFKLKAPHKPLKQNFAKYLNENHPYEDLVQEDNTCVGKKKPKDNDIPPDYDPNWANEF